MVNFLRMVLGLVCLPACWGMTRAFFDALAASAGTGISYETIAFLGGLAAFVLCWMSLTHPVRTYVLGHELTHALWGLCFGARPTDLRVTASGGSVRLTKSNLLVTLAPYFFPFYTFVVIVVALITYAFLRPLPCLPLWMFMIGFTWAFHILFTFETLTLKQPDIKMYGRIFSWVFIFIANMALVLIWLASTTPLTFANLSSSLLHHTLSAYLAVGEGSVQFVNWIVRLCSRT